MTDSNETATRTSCNTVIGANIADARVKSVFQRGGINATTSVLLKSLKEETFNFDELTTDQQAFLQQCVANRLAVIQKKHDLMAVKGGFGKDKVNPLEEWENMSETDQYSSALFDAHFRISGNVPVLLTAVVDDLVKDIARNAIEQKQAINAKAVHINLQYALSNIDSVSLYPLFYNSKVLADARASLETSDDEDSEEEKPAETTTNTQYFNYYMSGAVHSVNTNGYKIGLRNDFRKFLNDIAVEFITVRLTNIVRVLMELSNDRTIKDKHIYSAIRVMMLEGGANPDNYIATLVPRMDTYNEFQQCSTAEEKQKFVIDNNTAAPKVVKPARASKTEKAKPAETTEAEPAPEEETPKKSRSRRSKATDGDAKPRKSSRSKGDKDAKPRRRSRKTIAE